MTAPSSITLASLQARMASALLAADSDAQQLPPDWFGGAHAGAVGLRVHRNTVLGALSNALRLSYLAIDRLVGEDFFDRMAVEYARAEPPREPQLDVYGSGFAEFIAGFPGTERLPYLSELARLDWQLAELGRERCSTEGGAALLLEGGVRLHFVAPLRTFRAAYAVDRLRAAILAEDVEALGSVDLTAGEHSYALWRTEAGVNVRSLSASSARFLDAVLAGADGASALAAAASAQHSAEEIAAALTREILPAGFVRVGTVDP